MDDKNPIPLLDRPLGVKEPPSAEEKSWKERGSEFMDSEKQLEKRRALCVFDPPAPHVNCSFAYIGCDSAFAG